MSVHVTGCGLLGAFILQALDKRGIEFTWSDVDSPYTAWMASTGAILPQDDSSYELAAKGYRNWVGLLESADGKWRWIEPTIHITRGVRDERPSWIMDVPGYVRWVRELYAPHRVPQEVPAKLRIRARGVMEVEPFNPIPVWGWRSLVSLNVKETPRPSYHFVHPRRPVDWVAGGLYLYPCPWNWQLWLAGSDTLLQKHPIEQDQRAEQKINEFVEAANLNGIELERVGNVELIQGWRPKPRLSMKKAFGESLYFEPMEGVVLVRSLYKSGVQCGPMLAAEVAELAWRRR
jgi:hypothetical protein